jgi:APA family basic amino acid/polyamine antiporter
MGNLSIETWIRFGVWLVIGLVLYLTYGARRARLSRPEAVREPERVTVEG